MKVCSICQRCYEDAVVSCAESEHPELSETRAGSPEMIAGYRLDLLLESGIKGEVYRGLRIDSDQSCLIKIVAANEENRQKFLQNAKTATTLFNQSVVDVYEFGSLESGEVFVVAEDAAGQTVRELLNNVGVPQLLTTVQVVRQAAEAVHALHLSGLTHRAIRPENIILTTDAEHRLLVRIQNADLGGVAEHSIVTNKFLIDSALDSLRYFAPDQFSSEGSSAKSDVYSLGIVLYEMLAGTPPFDSDKASGLIDMHRNQRPPDVTIDNFDLRMLLTHTLMESLRKQPGKRQSSANAFARQLRHIEQLATHSPTPPAAGTVSQAPPLVNVAVASASAAVQPAAAIEMRQAVQVKKVQPVTTRLESEPVASKVKPEVIPFKAEPELLLFEEIEVVPEVDPEHVLDELADIPDVVDVPRAASEKVESEPRKSRLKRLKKQLHSFTAPLAAVAVASKTLPADDGSEAGTVEPPPEFTKVVAVQTEPGEMTIAPVKTLPRKIEWTQPEDDIPSIHESMEARSEEKILELQMIPATVSTTSTPVSIAPKKIEWVQPEDDIPSLDETFEVLSREQIPVTLDIEPAVSAASAPAPAAPRKIEWAQPEDDIPSMKDVMEVLGAEQIVVQPLPEDVLAAAPINAPTKVEWVQPDDDLPSMEDVMEVLATEQIVVQPLPEDVLAAAPINAPTKVEWVQPDDDLPSMEDVMEVLAIEQITESASVPPPEDVPAVTPINVLTKIEWAQPEDDIPSMKDVTEVLAIEQIAESASVPPVPEDMPAVTPINVLTKIELLQIEDDVASMEEALAAEVRIVPAEPAEGGIAGSYDEPVAIETIIAMPVVELEPEEITLVSPPRRIQIDWEQPKPWEAMSKEIEFFPTLLGDVDTKRKADAQSEPFFSDYYAEAEPRSSDHYRSLMIGSGFIALIVLFLFGNDSVWNYLQNGSPADSVAVKTTSTTQTFAQSGQTTTPNEQRVLKSFEKPRSEDDVETGQSKPSAIRVSTSSSDDISPADKTRPQNKPQTATSAKSVGKTPLVPSTLVISSDDGKISSKVEPQNKRSASKKQGSSVSMESTRPRIVQNPQP